MKYRRLTKEELQELEQEFVRFLASNSVTADEWVQLKSDTPEKAEGLIDVFSDIVFENILSKVEYMEHKQKNLLRVYHFLDDKVLMMGMVHRGNRVVDFAENLSVDEMLEQVREGQLELFSGEKKYKQLKEKEIFFILEEGALISKDPTLFNTLSELVKNV